MLARRAPALFATAKSPLARTSFRFLTIWSRCVLARTERWQRSQGLQTILQRAANHSSSAADDGLALSVTATGTKEDGSPAPALLDKEEERKGRRWTWEEDQSLRSLVTLHGEDWAQIALHFPGRDRASCSVRWKRISTPVSGTPFTPQEDLRLRELLEHYGRKWALIAKQMRGRTPRQCAARWDKVLNVSGHSRPWTDEEEATLAQLTSDPKNTAATISKHFPNRSYVKTYARARAVQQRAGRTAVGKWSHEELHQLMDAVQRFGKANWGQIAEHVPGRTATQCYTRYWYNTRVAPDAMQWSAAEDEQLIAAVDQLGSKDWRAVSLRVYNKDWRTCKFRWERHLLPKLNANTPWTVEEDAIIKDRFDNAKDVRYIVNDLIGRSQAAITHRWRTVLNPRKITRTTNWTSTEDQRLLQAVQEFGSVNNWGRVSEKVATRAAGACLSRYKRMRREGKIPHQD